jgi:MFS family permease
MDEDKIATNKTDTSAQEKYSVMLMPAILSVSLLTIMAPTAVAPALAAIKQAFPEITETEAKLVLTLPTLMMPIGLFAAKLTERFDKKKILLTGMLLFLVFGVGGGFVNDFGLLLTMRVLFGVGIGIMTPLSTSLIFDFVSDTNRRNKLMGIQGAVNQLGGLVFMGLSGILANISWRYSFLCYAFVLVSLLMTLLFMPSIPPFKSQVANSTAKKKHLNPKIYVLAFFAMMIFVCFFVVNTDLALFMHHEGLGDAKDCGFALSVMRIPAIFAGIMLGWLMKNLKDWTVTIATLFMAAGYLIIAYSYSYDMIMAGCLVIGIGGGVSIPPLFTFVPRLVPPRQRTLGVAIVSMVAQLGQFVSPLYTNIFVNGSDSESLRMRFVIATVTTVVIGFMVVAFASTISKVPLKDEI